MGSRTDAPHRRFAGKILRRADAIAAKYRIVLWREAGEWRGRGLEMPGCMGGGKTVTACVRVTRRSLVLGVAAMLRDREVPPAPQLDQEA